MDGRKALLIDITKCIGCQACESSCKQIHGFPTEHEPSLTATALTVVQDHDGKFVRRLCMHCEEPACASACLVGAIRKTSFGPVVYDAAKCIGCRYCMLACPNSVPKYQWSKLVPYMKKCDMCAERVAAGSMTACAEACPTGATTFGDRSQIVREARRRLLDDPNYVQKIYGEQEFGSTSVFFISDVPFEKLGFVTPTPEPLPNVTAAALGEVPTVVLVGGSLLAGLYWITQRRREVAAAEQRERERS